MNYCEILDLWYINVKVFSDEGFLTKKVKWPINGQLVFLDEYL